MGPNNLAGVLLKEHLDIQKEIPGIYINREKDYVSTEQAKERNLKRNQIF